MRTTGHAADQGRARDVEARRSGEEYSTASLQLDQLLQELSREAGFKGRGSTGSKKATKGRGMISTRDGAGRTFLSWETEDGAGRDGKDQKAGGCYGYFSDAEIEIGCSKEEPKSPKQKIINIDFRPKQRCYSAKVIEKTQTRQEYIKEEYHGNKAVSSSSSGILGKIDGRTCSIGTLDNESSASHKFQSQKMYSSDAEGIRIAPIPPPRKHLTSPDPFAESSCATYRTSTRQEQDYSSNTMSPVSSTSTLRHTRGPRFETTNSQHLSPPLEVKAITPASSEERRWLEEQKKKLERSRFSVDRVVSSGQHGAEHSFRSGSLDVDLDDLLQRNLTTRSTAVHHIASSMTEQGSKDGGSVHKGSYYISGIERPAVRTRLPQTKYIFKITSPDNDGGASATPKSPDCPPPPSVKTHSETFTTHVCAPPIPPSPQMDQDAADDPNLCDLENSLKAILDTSNSYKEQENIVKKLRPPKKDDEIISLEPIGPGVQLLEPEIGTLRGQTQKYQDGGSQRMDSRSNSLARHPPSPRTMSPSGQLGYATMTNSQAVQPVGYSTLDTYARQGNQTLHPQPFGYQAQAVPNSLTSHVSVKETYEYKRPVDNFAAQRGPQQQPQQHLQQQQQHQHSQQQQQHFQQHQQQLQAPNQIGYQSCFVPSPVGGPFVTEQHSSMSYTKTISNGNAAYPVSLPNSPMLTQRPLEYHAQNQSQREISIPIAIEGRSTQAYANTSHINALVSSGQSYSGNANYGRYEGDGSSYSASQMSKEGDAATLIRQVPIVHEHAKVNDGFEVKGSSGTSIHTSGSYTLEDKRRETYKVVESPVAGPHPISPDVNRSWTVSPSSSAVVTNMSTYKTESQEKRQDGSSLQIAENRSASQTSLSDYEAKLVRETANTWHKPHITRQEAVDMLRNKPSGSFVVRNSHSFAGGYGLALKVSHLPPNVQAKGDDYEANLVRHYLIESTPKGVKLKGCSNEPVFSSLSALIHQHSITPLSLPCKLLLPEQDKSHEFGSGANKISAADQSDVDYVNNNNNNNIPIYSTTTKQTKTTVTTVVDSSNNLNNATTTNSNTNNNIIGTNNNMGTLTSINSNFSTSSYVANNSVCQNGTVLYLDSHNTESLTGPEALWKAINAILESGWKRASLTKVDFRVSSQGVVLTDSRHKLFFRRHYPLEFISYCALDQSDKIRSISDDDGNTHSGRVFGFVAKKLGSQASNTCHLFMELDQKFTAAAAVGLINGLQQNLKVEY